MTCDTAPPPYSNSIPSQECPYPTNLPIFLETILPHEYIPRPSIQDNVTASIHYNQACVIHGVGGSGKSALAATCAAKFDDRCITWVVSGNNWAHILQGLEKLC